MPGVTLHIVLADRALRRWRMRATAPPFDLDDPVGLNAFWHGAVGPDLGYFPGGSRVLSDLAHCVRTGALTRTLLRTATTVRERAFALGWLTHYFADALIHPLIGRAVGELLTGSRDTFVDGSSDLPAHLRVEMGVDAWYALRHPEVRHRRLSIAFSRDESRFLADAYASTYGVPFDAETFFRSHRSSSRRVGQALASQRLVGALMAPSRGLTAALRAALGAIYRSGILPATALAYLNPVAPSGWLLDAVENAGAEHVELVFRHGEDAGAALEDVNLDTGLPVSSERDHVGTRRALDALARLAA